MSIVCAIGVLFLVASVVAGVPFATQVLALNLNAMVSWEFVTILIVATISSWMTLTAFKQFGVDWTSTTAKLARFVAT